jgi:hypothetical protein
LSIRQVETHHGRVTFAVGELSDGVRYFYAPDPTV